MVSTAYFALSPVIGLFVTVAARIVPRDVASASRCQDHTTSPSRHDRSSFDMAASIASRAQRS
jgi:hypothetical protein